jgi:hypothetical protein
MNTAMSYALVVSNLTPESKTDTPHHRRSSKTTSNQSNVKKAWNTPPPTLITAPDTTYAGLDSELESSKLEVEALKLQMSKMEAEKVQQIKEIERKAEQQRADFEARAQEQRISLERQVETRRLELQHQLEEQRKSLEEQNRLRQQEIEARFQAQFNQPIQAHLPVSPTTPKRNGIQPPAIGSLLSTGPTMCLQNWHRHVTDEQLSSSSEFSRSRSSVLGRSHGSIRRL